MASTQYDVIVGMQLQNSGVARQAAAQVDAILQEYARLGRANVAGPMSQQSIDQFSTRLKEALRGAFEGSDVLQRLQAQRRGDGGRFAPTTERVVTSATATGSTPLLAQQLKLADAELARAQIAAKAALPLGSKGAYATAASRTRGEIQAGGAVERANVALENAILKQVREAEKAAGLPQKRQEALAREILAIQKNTRLSEEAKAREIQAIQRNTARAEAASRKEQEAVARAIVAITRRAAAEEADAERLAKADAFVPTPARFPNATSTTALGRSQVAVDATARQLEIATVRRAESLTAAGRTELSVAQAEARFQTATTAAATARERLAALEQRQAAEAAAAPAGAGGGRAGIGGQFAAGFRGGGDNPTPYAQQLGQAFKFSIFYGTAYKLLFGITETFKQTLQEGIEFQSAVSELKLVTEQAKDAINTNLDDLAEQLGSRATSAGFAPSEGVIAGARGIGLYGQTQGTAADQARVADISARVATRVAFNSGLQTQDVQTNIAAITNAFGTGAEGQFQVADLDAYFARRFGTQPGSGIQAVSESANVGAAAGFDQESINAIASLLQGRTGQTASTVAGYMAQIFSRGGEGSLTGVAARYGVDTTQVLADQIRDLANVYRDAKPNEQAQIAAAFGRGKIQNAATVLLGGYQEVDQAAQDARSGAATGASDKAFDIRIGNIGGQIQITTAILKEFANQLGQSGVLSVLGAGIVVLREVVEAGTGIVKLWNDLNPVIRAVIASMIALQLANRTGALGAVGSRIASGAGGVGLFRSAGGAYAAGAAPIAAGRIGIGTAAGAVAPLASRAGVGIAASAASGAALGLLTSPAVLAVGGLLAIGALKNKSDQLGGAFETATEALNTGNLGPSATRDQLNARASALRGTATDTREASGGVLADIKNFGADKDANLALADRLDAEAKRLAAVASETTADNASPDQQLITNFDKDGLTASLDAITAAGGTAGDRLDALAESVRGAGGAADRAAASFDAKKFADTNAAGVTDAIAGSGQVVQSNPSLSRIVVGGLVPGIKINPDDSYKNVLPDILNDYLTQGDVQKRLQDSLQGITDLSKLDPSAITDIATRVVGDTASQVGADNDLPEGSIKDLQNLMIGSVEDYLQTQVQQVRDIVTGNLSLTSGEVDAFIAQATAEVQSLVGGLDDSDLSGKVDAYRTAIAGVKAAIRAGGNNPSPVAVEGLAALEKAMAEQEFNRLEALRKRAQQNAGSRAEVARVGQGFLRREINAAVRGGNADVLVQIIGQAGEGARRMALAALREALKVAKAANELRSTALGQAINVDGEGFARGGLDLGKLPAGQDTSPILKQIKAVQNALTGGGKKSDNVYASGSDVPGYEAPDTSTEDKETAGDRAAAAAAARAVRSESPIAQARADIIGAKNELSKAKKGTVEYYNALSSLYSAQQSLTDAILDYKSNKYLLGIDMTDPLAQAEVATRVARDKLRSDAGKGPDVIAADKVALRNAQAAEEQTKFQQRLDAVTTADDLGRISHAKYLNYLDREKARLEGIGKRTFQQQAQLDQIDGLLKEAASSMDAQFNFGDIRLPTPYEVRRRVEELAAPLTGRDTSNGTSAFSASALGASQRPAAGSTSNQTTIYIDGAETEKVKRIVEGVVGGGRTINTRTTGARRGR